MAKTNILSNAQLGFSAEINLLNLWSIKLSSKFHVLDFHKLKTKADIQNVLGQSLIR